MLQDTLNLLDVSRGELAKKLPGGSGGWNLQQRTQTLENTELSTQVGNELQAGERGYFFIIKSHRYPWIWA